jgi:predicted phosphodiesterase
VTRNRITRRRFATRLGLGVAAGMVTTLPAVAAVSGVRRRVVVMSDIHIGREADGLDGSEWLTRGLSDIDENIGEIDYGLTLGDITHHGDRKSLERYLRIRHKTRIPRWFELAGNHEHKGEGIHHFRTLVRDTAPYCHVDGNIAWFFVSDETDSVAGQISDESYRWLVRNIKANADKIIILCSHQPPPETIRRSSENAFCLHPRKKLKEMVSTLPIALWLCGHEHHRPYSSDNIVIRNDTTCINVASLNHAYGTRSSGSLILDIKDNGREIVARRRDHDRQRFMNDFALRIPLNRPVSLGPQLPFQLKTTESQIVCQDELPLLGK